MKNLYIDTRDLRIFNKQELASHRPASNHVLTPCQLPTNTLPTPTMVGVG